MSLSTEEKDQLNASYIESWFDLIEYGSEINEIYTAIVNFSGVLSPASVFYLSQTLLQQWGPGRLENFASREVWSLNPDRLLNQEDVLIFLKILPYTQDIFVDDKRQVITALLHDEGAVPSADLVSILFCSFTMILLNKYYNHVNNDERKHVTKLLRKIFHGRDDEPLLGDSLIVTESGVADVAARGQAIHNQCRVLFYVYGKVLVVNSAWRQQRLVVILDRKQSGLYHQTH